MSKQIIQHFKFPYAITFKRRYGRKTRYEYVEGQDVLTLRAASSSEAPAAFRVASHGSDNIGRAYEILSFDGDLWWPAMDFGGQVSASKFLTGLANGANYTVSG